MSCAVAPFDPAYALSLSEALCARICHDLSSPLGSLMGALELAVEDPSTVDEALPLANETVLVMGQRLKLLRAAWAGECGPLSGLAVAALAAGLPRRIRLVMDGMGEATFSAPVARVVLNMLLLGADALPRGGFLTLAGVPDGDIMLSAEGPGAAWPSGLARALAEPRAVSVDEPRLVQAPLAAMLARASGLRLSLPMAAGPATPGVAPLLLTAD